MEKKQRLNRGVSRVGKQLPWHSPQRNAKNPTACAKADSEVPASLMKGTVNVTAPGVQA